MLNCQAELVSSIIQVSADATCLVQVASMMELPVYPRVLLLRADAKIPQAVGLMRTQLPSFVKEIGFYDFAGPLAVGFTVGVHDGPVG